MAYSFKTTCKYILKLCAIMPKTLGFGVLEVLNNSLAVAILADFET
jgi:hypothetical protein